MAEPDLSLAQPLPPSPDGWLDTVMADFDAFLSDHASCEKKASGMALSVASHYPDRPLLLTAMAELAAEELAHYREVIKLMVQRGLVPGADAKDPYIHALNKCIRRGPENFLLDRLLVGAVVERRGAERFALIAGRLSKAPHTNQPLAEFYSEIAASESRHWHLFVELALSETHHTNDVWLRFNELVVLEAEIMSSVPLRAALH